MSKTINAVYEDGVFKPLEPVSLNEHERVKLDINMDEHLRKQLRILTEKGILPELRKNFSTVNSYTIIFPLLILFADFDMKMFDRIH